MSSSFAEQKTEMIQRGWRPVVIEGKVVWLSPQEYASYRYEQEHGISLEEKGREVTERLERDLEYERQVEEYEEAIQEGLGGVRPPPPEAGSRSPEEPWTPPEKIYVEDSVYPYGTLYETLGVDWERQRAPYLMKRGQSVKMQWFGFQELQEMTQYTPESISASEESFLERDILHREQVHKKREAKEEYQRDLELYEAQLKSLETASGSKEISDPNIPLTAQVLLGKSPMELGLDLKASVPAKRDAVADFVSKAILTEELAFKIEKLQRSQVKVKPMDPRPTVGTPREGSVGDKLQKQFDKGLTNIDRWFMEREAQLSEAVSRPLAMARKLKETEPALGLGYALAGGVGFVAVGGVKTVTSIVNPRALGRTVYGISQLPVMVATAEGREALWRGLGEASAVHPMGASGLVLETMGQIIGGYALGKAVSRVLPKATEIRRAETAVIEVESTLEGQQTLRTLTGGKKTVPSKAVFLEEFEEFSKFGDELAVTGKRTVGKLTGWGDEIEEFMDTGKTVKSSHPGTEVYDEILVGDEVIGKELQKRVTVQGEPSASFFDKTTKGLLSEAELKMVKTGESVEFGGVYYDESAERILGKGDYKFDVKGAFGQADEATQKIDDFIPVEKPPEGFKGTPLSKTFGGTTQEAQIIEELTQAERPIVSVKQVPTTLKGVEYLGAVSTLTRQAPTPMEPEAIPISKPRTKPSTEPKPTPYVEPILKPVESLRPVEPQGVTPLVKPRLREVEVSKTTPIITPTEIVKPTPKQVSRTKPVQRIDYEPLETIAPRTLEFIEPTMKPVETLKPTQTPFLTPITTGRVKPLEIERIASIEQVKQVQRPSYTRHYSPRPYRSRSQPIIPWGVRMGGRRTRGTWSLNVFGEKRKYPVKDPLKVLGTIKKRDKFKLI